MKLAVARSRISGSAKAAGEETSSIRFLQFAWIQNCYLFCPQAHRISNPHRCRDSDFCLDPMRFAVAQWRIPGSAGQQANRRHQFVSCNSHGFRIAISFALTYIRFLIPTGAAIQISPFSGEILS